MWISKGKWATKEPKIGSRNENCFFDKDFRISNLNCLRAKRAEKKWEIGIVFIENCDLILQNTILIWNCFDVLTNTISNWNNTAFFSGTLRAQFGFEIRPKKSRFFVFLISMWKNWEFVGGDNYTTSPVPPDRKITIFCIEAIPFFNSGDFLEFEKKLIFLF